MVIHIHDISKSASQLQASAQLEWNGPYLGGSVYSELTSFPPSFCYNIFSTEEDFSTYQILDEDVDGNSTTDLRAVQTSARRFFHNFLGFSLLSNHRLWIRDENEWRIRLNNISALARVARAGKLKGVFVDPEPGGIIWTWSQLACKPGYENTTFEQVRETVFQRGKDVIKTISSVFSGCIIWLTMGYSQVLRANGRGNERRDTDGSSRLCGQDGLWGIFLDGMLEGSDTNMIFIDGCEGYNYQPNPDEQSRWEKLIKYVTQEAIHYTVVPEKFMEKMRVGFGVRPRRSATYDWMTLQEDLDLALRLLREEPAWSFNHGKRYIWTWEDHPSTWWLPPGETSFPDTPEQRVFQRLLSRKGQSKPWGHTPFSLEERCTLASRNPQIPQGSGTQTAFLPLGMCDCGPGLAEIRGLPRETRVVFGNVVKVRSERGVIVPEADGTVGEEQFKVITHSTKLHMHGDEPVCYVSFETLGYPPDSQTDQPRPLAVMLIYGPGR